VKRLIERALFISLLLFTADAYAACSVSTPAINFGNYDSFVTAPLNTTGTITVSCDTAPPVDVTISISASLNSGLFNPRQMKHATRPNLLDYNLYTKQNRTTVWGDGTGGTSTVVVKGTRQRNVTVYGSITPRQNVPPGIYGDILTVTITP
jgi:spore coat protein U-like protein